MLLIPTPYMGRLIVLVVLAIAVPVFCPAGETEPAWFSNIENQWGGHLRIDGAITTYDDDSFYQPVGTDTGYDGLFNLRLKDKLFLSDRVYGEAHYEAYLDWGDTYTKHYQLKHMVPAPDTHIPLSGISDRRRLFDLTKILKETEDYNLYHRLDRMLLSYRPTWGDITVGRQAVTWGNGLVFNPMDLFNPFAPSDTVRDYKIGDDLASLRFNTHRFGEFNILYVPRRDDITGEIDTHSSSYAGKTHLFFHTMEFDLMLARHFGETVFGAGGTGYLWDAAWRTDIVWSTLEDISSKNGYLTLVANMDYSWVLFEKNMYGLVEYYHNGLGKHQYSHAFTDPVLAERLARGEMFTLGRNYISGQIQMELHPLFNLYLGLINNIKDPSGLIQPRGIWNMTQDAILQFGINSHYGKKGDEFGGIQIPGTDLYTTSPESSYLMLTYFF